MVALPRVPDERAGWYSRAGLLGGLGASVNKCQQYRKQHSVGQVGGSFGRGKIYLGS